MVPRKVIFAYRPGQQSMGGKTMRVDQLAAMARDLMGPGYDVVTAVAPRMRQARAGRVFLRGCRDAIVIFHKSAAGTIGPENRARLRSVAAGICVDHLDIVAPPLETGFFDVHIAASIAGERALIAGLANLGVAPGTQVRHLPHHADPRLAPADPAPRRFTPGYFGLPGNAVLPEGAGAPALMPEYRGIGQVSGDFLAQAAQANFHICTRVPWPGRNKGIEACKPFTKGFNAAAVGANVLVNRQVHDAEYYLGTDYPYMIEDCSQPAMAEGLARAAADFGGPTWDRARAMMGRMAQRVTPAAVVAELEKICRLF